MLTITIPGEEFFNEKDSEFVRSDDVVLELEHSLATLSKWEEIYEKPFLGKDVKTTEETLGYIKVMIRNPKYPEDIFQRFTQEHFDAIDAYINAKSSATWFGDTKNASRNQRIITAELIYYWMISANIPVSEFEHWHLNRLFTLLKVFEVESQAQKDQKPKKLGRSEIDERRALNEKRKQQLKTRG